MPRGGKRQGAGRPKGRKNNATIEQKASLSELARSYVPDALESLAQVMRAGISEAARVSAAIALLDRAYGKPRQAPMVEETESEDALTRWLLEISDSQKSRMPIAALEKGKSAPES